MQTNAAIKFPMYAERGPTVRRWKGPRNRLTVHFQTKGLSVHRAKVQLPLMSEMQRVYSLIEITTGGGVAQAAGNLLLKDNEHVPQLSEQEFTHTREDASVAAAIIMHTAKRRLSIKQDADDPFVANLIDTARSVELPDVQ